MESIISELRQYVRLVIAEALEDIASRSALYTVGDVKKYEMSLEDTRAWVATVINELRNWYPTKANDANKSLLIFLKTTLPKWLEQKKPIEQIMNEARKIHASSLKGLIKFGIVEMVLENVKEKYEKKSKKSRTPVEQEYLDNFDRYVDFWSNIGYSHLEQDFDMTMKKLYGVTWKEDLEGYYEI